MTSREQALAEVNAGDIIFGVGTGGQPKLLLVYRVHEEGSRPGISRPKPIIGSTATVRPAFMPMAARLPSCLPPGLMRSGSRSPLGWIVRLPGGQNTPIPF